MTTHRFIPLCVPHFAGNEWQYVKDCIDTSWVSSVGEYVDRFEQLVADFVGARYTVATVNGTSALHIALQLADVQPEDEVLVSTMTFIAPANAIRYVGAWPVFVDAEAQYWQMDPQKLVDFVEHGCRWRNGHLFNRATGRRVTAIMPVDVLGHPVDFAPILEIARKYDFTVIEDATEALGAEYRGREAGRLGDIGCLSFNGNKLITTGGGGMLVTDNEAWADRARHLTTQAKNDPIEYIHDEVGYNYRLTNLQAALGVAQMEQLESYVETKRRIASTYNETLSGIDGIEPMREAPWAYSTSWMYTVLVNEAACGMGSRDLRRTLAGHDIQTRPLWQPLHLSSAHQGSFATDCSVAERLYCDALSLPCSVGLSPEDQQTVTDQITLACAPACVGVSTFSGVESRFGVADVKS